jgi:PAS domain S-box-containing protein
MDKKTVDIDIFKNIFESSVNGILVVDADGIIIKANHAIEQLFGYSPGELLKQKLEILIPNKFKKVHQSHREGYLVKPKARLMGAGLELWGLKKDGSQFPLEISLSPTKIKEKQVVVAFVMDCAKRKANQEALVVSEHRMAEAQRLSHIGSWYWNIKTNERHWSDEFYRIFGLPYKDERLRKETVIDFIHPDDRESAVEALNTAIKNQTPYSHKNRILRPDGTIRYILGKGRVRYDEKGNPLEMVGTMQDITEQKELKDSLFESNRKTSTLVSNLNGVAYRCKNDRDWTMVYISEGCKSITGYSPEAFLEGEVHFSHITFKEDQEEVWNATQKGVLQHASFSLSYRIRDKQGNIKYLQEIGRGIYDKNGKLEALEGFITDVTAQKNTKTELSDSEDQTRALLEANPDMMFIQNHQGEYLEFHGNSAEKFFILPKNFIGLNMKNVLPLDVYKKIKISHDKVLATKKMQVADYSIQGKKGMEHYEARVVLLNDRKLLTIVRDVTEEKVKDVILNIRNNALASASNSIIIADAQQPNTPIIYCNNAFEKTTGYTSEEVCGRNCNFLQDNDRDQQEIEILKNAIANGLICNVVLRNYKKDGTLFWNDVTIAPVHDEAGKLTHFIGVQNDVTDKIKQESLKNKTRKILELMALDKSLKTISRKIIETVESYLEDCVASILILDKDRKTLYKLAAPNLPEAFCNLIEGTAIESQLSPCSTAVFLKNEVIISNIATNGRGEDYKKMALKHGLKACWAFPIMSSTHKVLGVVSIYSRFTRNPSPIEKKLLLDMTYLTSIALEAKAKTIVLNENKRELEDNAEKLEEKILERTKEVMATVEKLVASNLGLEDQIQETLNAEKSAAASKSLSSAIAQNFPNGFIIVFNPQLEMLLIEGETIIQLGLDNMVSKDANVNDITMFSEEQKIKLKQDILKTIAGEHLGFEIQYRNLYFSVNTIPLRDDDNVISNALFVFSDITIQKKIERDDKNALKKEQDLNELKSRFVSMASHEFRTPLSAIQTSAILIGRQNEAGNEQKREKYVAQIKKNVKQLVIILNDFLSLSKLEEGKVKANNEWFDFVNLSKKISKEVSLTKKIGGNIIFSSPDHPLLLNLDPKLVRHILMNLLSNAIKYSAKNADITLKIEDNDQFVFLEVKDQGIGIPEDEQDRLFERFFRAKNAQNIQGTGLGLNIVKQYVDLMDGTITVKSKVNTGTTFLVKWPKPNIPI